MDAANTVTVNVGALSTALASALQQAAGPSSSPASGLASHPNNSANQGSQISRVTLPSYLARKRLEKKSEKASKRSRSVNSWDRDIVCLPSSKKETSISYPHGKYRAWLAEKCLVGKIHLDSTMTEDEVKAEVRSVFSRPMGGRSDFSFTYLQPTGAGTRSLSIPAVSSTFRWSPEQVVKLAVSKQTIYILADEPLDISAEGINGGESSESDSEESKSSFVREKEQIPPEVKQDIAGSGRDNTLYQKYANLIDLTGVSESDGCADSDRDGDDHPSASFCTSSHSSCYAIDDKPDVIKAKHVMLEHRRKVISDEDVQQRINVRRSQLFPDSIRAFSRPTFDVSKQLNVVFIGESAVDDGGPRREYFQLLLQETFSSSGLFLGWPDHVIPLHHVGAVAANHFYLVGKMLSTCLVQGGQPPVCFAAAVADYLVFGEVRSEPCIADIPDCCIRQKLEKVQKATSTEGLRRILREDDYNFSFDCGYTKPITRMELSDCAQFVKAIWLHFVFFLPHAELEQLRKGLNETLKFELVASLHPLEIRSFFAASSAYDVTPNFLLDSFVIHYSDPGSNKRTEEEAVMINWNDYIMEIEDNGDVNISDVLHFFSGSSKLPATGFSSHPSIYFTNDKCLPKSSTCDLSITFPRSLGHLTYDEFKAKMNMCVLDSFGFGQV